MKRQSKFQKLNSQRGDHFRVHRKSTGCPETVIRLATVPESREYIAASIELDKVWTQLARIAPEDPADSDNGRFILEWRIPDKTAEERELRKQAQRKFDFFLVRLGESRPWTYLCHHCTTASNLYSGANGGVYFEWHNRDHANSQ